jgi:hypothetical protein
MKAISEGVFLLKTNAMRLLLTSLLITIALFSCKDQTSNEAIDKEDTEITELTTAERIAANYGIDHWSSVSELSFTFNVSRGESGFGRSFVWNTKTDDVVFMSEKDTIQYNRKMELDSLQTNADMRFVNDSFWLLSPFKLVWDEGTTLSEEKEVIAPISKDTLNKVTIVYGSEGGYTPGDAYDFYYTNDYTIKEWAYRRGNSEKASTITSWDKTETIGGLKFNTVHRDSLNSFKLFFTNVSVK